MQNEAKKTGKQQNDMAGEMKRAFAQYKAGKPVAGKDKDTGK